jgi:hypothetical protein
VIPPRDYPFAVHLVACLLAIAAGLTPYLLVR